jgi:hypothetical protein
MTRTEYLEQWREDMQLLAKGEITTCTCPHTDCPIYGDCKSCVALHKHKGDHLPYCLQPLLIKSVKRLCEVVECAAVANPERPDGHRLFVRNTLLSEGLIKEVRNT